MGRINTALRLAPRGSQSPVATAPGMQHAPDTISISESAFITSALTSGGLRVDGRRALEPRPLSITFGAQVGSVTVQLGKTKVLAVASAELVEPYPDRPAEGVLQFFAELSPMASPAFEPGRPPEAAVEIMRLLDRVMRKSQAVDIESLCIVAGKSVWSVRCDVTVLDCCGNMTDAALFAALMALKHLRLPPLKMVGVGDEATVSVLPFNEGICTPLTFHHTPVAVSMGFFKPNDGSQLLAVIDPTDREEVVMQGLVTVVLNQHQELCALHKPGGLPIAGTQLFECIKHAAAVAPQRLLTLESMLQEHALQLAAEAETLRRTGRAEKRKQVVADAPLVAVSPAAVASVPASAGKDAGVSGVPSAQGLVSSTMKRGRSDSPAQQLSSPK